MRRRRGASRAPKRASVTTNRRMHGLRTKPNRETAGRSLAYSCCPTRAQIACRRQTAFASLLSGQITHKRQSLPVLAIICASARHRPASGGRDASFGRSSPLRVQPQGATLERTPPSLVTERAMRASLEIADGMEAAWEGSGVIGRGSSESSRYTNFLDTTSRRG